jgi:hypothetical protein
MTKQPYTRALSAQTGTVCVSKAKSESPFPSPPGHNNTIRKTPKRSLHLPVGMVGGCTEKNAVMVSAKSRVTDQGAVSLMSFSIN